MHAGVVRDRGLDRVGVGDDDHELTGVLRHHRFQRGDQTYLVINARDITETVRVRLEREAILDNASVGVVPIYVLMDAG